MVRKYKVIPLGLSLSKILSDRNQLLVYKHAMGEVTVVTCLKNPNIIWPKTAFFYFCTFTSIFKTCIKQTSQQSASHAAI